jgi:hypothetical protein
MRSMLPFALVGGLAGLLLVLPPAGPARGCGMVFRNGTEGVSVSVAFENAIIVWDEAAKTEHFVRRAQFASTSADFGFLVPTPSAPDLAVVGDPAFWSLATVTAPKELYETRITTEYGLGPSGLFCAGSPAPKSAARGFDAVGAAMPSAPVQVLKEQRVGGYDAAVLRADDPKKLREWLTEHGYQSRPELDSWLKAYTDNKWVLTAFKVAAQTGGPAPPNGPRAANLTAVRMSFPTEKPFYPYREPEDARKPTGAERLLRVYFFAGKRYAGTIGTSGEWPGKAVWSGAVAVPTLPEAKLDGVRTWRLTEFEDHSSPRPGTDEVYFAPDADQSTRERPPIVHVAYQVEYWPGWGGAVVGLMPILMIVGVYGIWRLARREREATQKLPRNDQ